MIKYEEQEEEEDPGGLFPGARDLSAPRQDPVIFRPSRSNGRVGSARADAARVGRSVGRSVGHWSDSVGLRRAPSGSVAADDGRPRWKGD